MEILASKKLDRKLIYLQIGVLKLETKLKTYQKVV